MKKRNIYKYLIVTVIVAIVMIYFYNLYKTDQYAVQDIPSPRGADVQQMYDFDQKCPLFNLTFEGVTKDFRLLNDRCSGEEKYKDKVPDGQEATVEIYTSDFEDGKTKFREWLTSHNLEESDKLRITYEHKPK